MKKFTMAQFVRLMALISNMQNEHSMHAQGDNGQDVRNREERYRKKIEALLYK
jgi:hypothetical protein